MSLPMIRGGSPQLIAGNDAELATFLFQYKDKIYAINAQIHTACPRAFYCSIQSVYIRTVSYKHMLPALQNWLKQLFWTFEQRNITLGLLYTLICPNLPGKMYKRVGRVLLFYRIYCGPIPNLALKKTNVINLDLTVF